MPHSRHHRSPSPQAKTNSVLPPRTDLNMSAQRRAILRHKKDLHASWVAQHEQQHQQLLESRDAQRLMLQNLLVEAVRFERETPLQAKPGAKTAYFLNKHTYTMLRLDIDTLTTRTTTPYLHIVRQLASLPCWTAEGETRRPSPATVVEPEP